MNKLIMAATLLFLWHQGNSFAANYLPLELRDLRKKKTEGCVILHPWANWCAPCLEELPGLLKALREINGVKAVVVDLSDSKSRQASQKFFDTLESSFGITLATYFLHAHEKETERREVIASKWDGTLPITILYGCDGDQCGIERGRWVGRVPLIELKKAVATRCIKPKSVGSRRKMTNGRQ